MSSALFFKYNIMENKEIKLFDDPKLVEYRTDLEGWTGPDKLYYGKGEEGERRARAANSTHKKCECGNVFLKNSYCDVCAAERRKKDFLKKEEVEWDGESYMCIRDDEKFFSDMDDFFEWCEQEEIEDPTQVELMLCERDIKISEIDIDELNEEYCSEDGEKGVCYYHPEIAEKVDELNKLIRNAKPIFWFQTNKRIKIPPIPDGYYTNLM